MIYDYLNIIFKKLKSQVWLKPALAVVTLLLTGFIIFTVFFSRGDLEVNTEGPEGDVTIYITDLKSVKDGSESKDIIIKGRQAKTKLKPGDYKVTSTISPTNQVGDKKSSSSSFKEVSIKSRSKTALNIKVGKSEVNSVQDLVDKPAIVNLIGNNLYSTSVYGVTKVYDLKNDTSTILRKEPAYLRGIVGVCNFDNGRTLAIDKEGIIYSLSGSVASIVDLSSYFEEEAPELTYSSVINGTREFICQGDKVLISGVLEVSSSMVPTSLDSDPYSKVGGYNVTSFSDGSLWFFDAVDEDSFDHESSSSKQPSKTIVRVDKDGSKKELDLGSYASTVSPYSENGFCFYYQKVIKCGDISTNKMGESFVLPESRLISNLVTIDPNRVAYSYANSAWVLNIESGISSQLYSSEYEIIPRTVSIEQSLGLVTFGAQKITSENSIYSAPIISYGDLGN